MREEHLKRVSIARGGAIRKNIGRTSIVGIGRKSMRGTGGTLRSALPYNQNYTDYVIDESTHCDLENSNSNEKSGVNDDGLVPEPKALARKLSFQRALAREHEWQAWFEMTRKKKQPSMKALNRRKAAASSADSDRIMAVDGKEEATRNTEVDAKRVGGKVDQEMAAGTTPAEAVSDFVGDLEEGSRSDRLGDDGQSEGGEENAARARDDVQRTNKNTNAKENEKFKDETTSPWRLPTDATSNADSEETEDTASWTTDDEVERVEEAEKGEEEEEEHDDSTFLDPNG